MEKDNKNSNHKGGHRVGAPKTGGRKKGTPNKKTAVNKAIITDIISQYYDSGLMATDFASLDSKDRIQIAEKLMQYVLPKCQAIAMDINPEGGKGTTEDRLAELSREQN